MIILQSIRIRNFRAIAEATFKPLEEGITGIVGANGAGKTTFLSATLWALYGIRPPDAPVGSLRREGSTGECSVSVVFRHQQQQIEVIRELKGGGKSNHTVVNIYVDGIEQTVASVSAADQWVNQRLGIDSTGFLSAFVVRQKELDQLITATPSVRKALIERLAGVDTINAALKAAREDENQAKRILQSAYGSEQEVLDTENNMNLLADKHEHLVANREELLKRNNALQARANAVRGELNTLREAALTQTRESSRLEGLRRETTDLQARVASLDYLASMPDNGSELEDLRRRHVDLNSRLSELSAQVNDQKVQFRGLETNLNNIELRLHAIDQFLASEPARQSFTDDLVEQLTKQSELIANAGERRAILTSRIQGFEESIHTLGHSAECPVCHTHLADPDGLVKTFRDTILEAQAEIASLQKAVSNAREEEQNLREQIALHTRVQAETEEQGNLKTQQQETRASMMALEESIAAAEQEAHGLNEALEEVRTLGVKARSLADDRKTLLDTQQRLTQNEANIETAEQNLATATGTLTAGNYEALERESADLQAEIQKLEPTVREALNDASKIESSLAVAKNNYLKAVEDWNRRKELLKRQERLSLTTDLIDRFRRDTIASLAPEISEYATGLISDMTSGEFTEIKLDDEFNAFVVTREGALRAVTWLSGGELSAVALAIRISLGFLISGGNPELLWLDEVLTAQDAERRTSMLSLIRSLPVSQIIMINHSEGFADILDKTVTLEIDRKNGSFIEDD